MSLTKPTQKENHNNLLDIQDCVCHIRLYSERDAPNSFVGNGTGFFWKDKENTYLVSNWHVFSGKKNETDKQEHDNLYLEVWYNTIDGWLSFPEKLLIRENGLSKWLQYDYKPNGEPTADLAILKLPKEHEKIKALNIILDKNKNNFSITPEPTMPVSIVGYPFLPDPLQENKQRLLWTSGYIAEFPDTSKLEFLVNAFPYDGMSGSPVFWIFQNRPINLSPTGTTLTNGSAATFVEFLGIYSGRRLLPDENGREYPLPMAVVWKPSLIHKILAQSEDKLNFSA